MAARRKRRPTHLPPGPRTVVIAGDDAGPPARVLAERAGWPLFAEPSSGSRTGANPIRTYRLLLDTELGSRIERAVVLGHPTLSRPVGRLLARPDVEVVSVRTQGRWPDRPFPVSAEHDRGQRAGRAAASRLARRVAGGRPCAGRQGRRLRGRAARPDAVRRGSGGQRSQPAGRPALRGRQQPDPRPGPDGHRPARRRAPDGAGQPGPRRDRRHRLDARSARRSAGRTAPARSSTSATSPSCTTPPRSSSVRASAPGPDHRGRQRRRRVDLRHAGAGSTRARRRRTTCCSARPTASTWRACAPPPVRRTGGSPTAAELEHALASPNGGIEVIEAVVRRDNRRDLDQQLVALAHS